MSKAGARVGTALAELRAHADEQRAGVNALIDSHNELQDSVRDLKMRLTFCMERVVVRKRRDPGALITANESEIRELTLAQLWLEDGPKYIAMIEAHTHALKALVEKAERGADALAAAVADEFDDRGHSTPQSAP